MGWYGSDLYLAVKCDEPTPDKIKTDANNYRDGWYPDDNVEFFFSSDKDPKGFYQFVTNSRGARWCNFSKFMTKTGETWESVSYKGEDFWSVEVKIPFELFGLGDDLKGKLFWFNLARAANNNPENEKLTSFANVKKGFADVRNFTALSFEDNLAVPCENLAKIKKSLARYQNWLRKKLWRIAFVKETFLQKHLESRYIDEKAQELVQLKKEAKKLFTSKDFSKVPAIIRKYNKLASQLDVSMKKIVLRMQSRDARAKLYLNGKELIPEADGRYIIKIKEGMSVFGVECTGSGNNPGVQISIDGLPETDFRWKYALKEEKKWFGNNFNDKNWKQVSKLPEGYVWSSNPSDREIYLRQVILWNQSHNGPNRCINPLTREWLFSKNSTEAIFLCLYSPFQYPLQDYEFVLEIPEGFRLLDMNHKAPTDFFGRGVKINCVPEKVVEEKVSRNGLNYTRYKILYNAEDVLNTRTFSSILPVKLEDFPAKETFFYFRRLAMGNFTELEQCLPVKILPPIQGKMPQKIMISQYVGNVYLGAHVSDEYLEELIAQSVRAGFNQWIMYPYGGEYTNLQKSLIVSHKARIVLYYSNHPIWGNRGKGDLLALLTNIPEARARYFNNTSDWKKAGMYCPTYVTGEGRGKFVEAITTDLKNALAFLVSPAEIYFCNWECQPWMKSSAYSSAQTGDKSYCFCDRCKKAFKKSIGMPENQELPDNLIFEKYYKEWADFRYKLDGKIQGLVRDACHNINLKYMVYSWTVHHKFWEACKGNIDIAFSGCPGNGVADSGSQENLDRTMDFFRDKVGLKRVLGQRFSFFGVAFGGGRPDDWKKFPVMSGDGYVDAKSWKSQFIRIAASLHGGIDLQSSLECVSGMFYYIGEATRIISEYEDLFYDGKRQDSLATSGQIKYPNLLVLTKGDERLVLLFNEGNKPLKVILQNKNLKPGQSASVYGDSKIIGNPVKMNIIIKPEDVAVVHIK